MNQPDVRQLSDQEALDEAPFPAPRRADFRVHIAPDVHRGIAQHAATDTSVEICGVLVGQWKQDPDGPFAVVTDYIRCDSASSKFAEVTFTHESWAQINQEMDTRYADSRIIGWYHSHPDFGIFLSDRDRFIQENFFSGAGQVAYVVDPVRKLEGVFAWKDGKPEAVSQYWVGERIVPVEASETPRRPPDGGSRDTPHQTSAGSPHVTGPLERSRFDLSLLLMGLCIFLLGYLLASTKSRWDQERIIQGTVAHYGVTKLMRLGFEKQLRETRDRLGLIEAEVSALLSQDQSKLNEEQQTEFSQRRTRLTLALNQSRETLRHVEETYGYTETELAALASYVTAKQAELENLLKSQQSSRADSQAPRNSKASDPSPKADGAETPSAAASDATKAGRTAPPAADASPPAQTSRAPDGPPVGDLPPASDN